MGVILHIIVVGFHHAHGPIVEYAYPPFPGQAEKNVLTRLEVPEEWSLLPFLALPDGSHQSDEDFTYFHLPPVKSRKDVASTLFGISCNRQILTKDLVVKTDDVTRSSVQKAIVVLATQPIFGVLRQRLAVVTAAWFGQKDFTQTEILAQFYDSLNATVSESIPDSAFLMGTSLRELVKKFKYKVLVLLKLLLLEKRVIFFGYPVETLCTYQYSLMSLVPGLLKALQDTGSPLLDSQEVYMRSMSKTPAHSTDKQELFKYLGLPLHIFGEGSFFQPYLPLQQIDILQDPRTRSYIIGTTNAIFLHNRDCGTDVIVNTEPGTIEFLQDSLSGILSLTSADRRWMDEIIQAVNESGSTDSQTEYAGSDDYLRAKFEEYILTLLSSVKHAQKVTQTEDSTEGMGNPSDRDLTADYGTYFIRAWQQTPNYQLWNDYVDWELLNEIVAPGHPCQGNFSLAHVQRRLANQLKDMRIDKNLVPLKQSFSRAMTTSRERLSNVFDSVWQEFEKLQPEEGPQPTSLEPGIYRPRSREPSLAEGKGLVRSTSTNRGQEPTARSIPDPDAIPDDDSNDAISPPVSYKSLSRRTSMQQQPASRTSSATASPVSSITSSLGPATAATAALGQKAAGMFSNVSSFFQAKKKELLDAQREAEEQYQQRVHQHERKKRVMQERARATASTFAISPKPVVGVAKANPGSGSGPDSAVSQQQQQQQSEPGLFSFVTPRSPTRSQASPRSPTSPKGARSPLSFNGMATGSPKPADASTATTRKSTDVVDESAKSVPIESPVSVPATPPTVVSPRLSRGGEIMSSIGEGGLVKDVDQESQQEIEKELLEALETHDIIVSTPSLASPSASRLSIVAAAQPGLTSLLTPTTGRSVTPVGESYSPFSEVSVPSSPVIGATEDSAMVVDDPLGVSSSQEELKSKEAAVAATGDGETVSSTSTGTDAAVLGEALPIP